MSSYKKLKVNTLLPLLNTVVLSAISIVLPRMIIVSYGSEINGLLVSIANFTSVMTLLDMGVGAVVQSSFYKPLSENNISLISEVYRSSRRFFSRITVVLIAFTAFVSLAYPIAVKTDLPYYVVSFLVVTVSLGNYAKSYLGITDSLLLNAHEKIYIPVALNILCFITGFLAMVFMIKNNIPIALVELVPFVVFSIKPIALKLYVKKNYPIIRDVDFSDEPIKQKWNGIAQHLAFYVTTNVDVIFITLALSVKEVSVYSVYNMVASGLAGLLIVLQSGVQPVLGKYYATDSQKELLSFFKRYEFIVHIATTLAFTCALILMVPFITVYTSGVDDADYIKPLFSALICLAQFFYSLRFPYHSLVIAAGHFKQTQLSSAIEMLLNIVLTVLLIFRFGLTGVVIGTLVSLVYRFVYLVFYTGKIVTGYSAGNGIKLLLADVISVAVSFLLCFSFTMHQATYVGWAIMAVKVFAISVLVVFVTELVFNRKDIMELFCTIIHKERLN